MVGFRSPAVEESMPWKRLRNIGLNVVFFGRIQYKIPNGQNVDLVFCPFGVLSIWDFVYSEFCPIQNFVHSQCCPVRDFVFVGFVRKRNLAQWLKQSCKSGRAFRVGFGPGSDVKLTKFSGLIRAWDVRFILGEQKYNQNNLTTLLNFSNPTSLLFFFRAWFGLQISFRVRAGFGP